MNCIQDRHAEGRSCCVYDTFNHSWVSLRRLKMFEFDCINCDTEGVGLMASQPLVDGHSLADFRHWIRQSDAVVLAAIYSGRAPSPSSPFETPAAAVARIAPAATRFQLMQLGICLLNESDGGAYVARPFTIDVFPAVVAYRRDLLSKTLFDCEASHMKSLSDQNFDFNRVFNSGMNWFSPKDEVDPSSFYFSTFLTKSVTSSRHICWRR